MRKTPFFAPGEAEPERARLLPGACLFIAALLASLSLQAAPDVGDPAPDFSLPGSDGETYTLSALRGKHVVIAFFPKAFTGG